MERSVRMDIRLKIANFPDGAPRGAVSEFCATYRISRSWFHERRARARAEGPLAAAAPRSRAPIHRPRLTAPEVEGCALLVRQQLAEEGPDNGPTSVRHRMLSACRGQPCQ